jgi:hypothetical protein
VVLGKFPKCDLVFVEKLDWLPEQRAKRQHRLLMAGDNEKTVNFRPVKNRFAGV